MSVPPIVGVPAFVWWLAGPSARICCPTCSDQRADERGAEQKRE